MPTIVSPPPRCTSSVYSPTARSFSTRVTSSAERPPRYSTSTPKRSLNARGRFWRVAGVGLDESTSVPSARAAAASSCQNGVSYMVALPLVAAGAAPPARGADDVLDAAGLPQATRRAPTSISRSPCLAIHSPPRAAGHSSRCAVLHPLGEAHGAPHAGVGAIQGQVL